MKREERELYGKLRKAVRRAQAEGPAPVRRRARMRSVDLGGGVVFGGFMVILCAGIGSSTALESAGQRALMTLLLTLLSLNLHTQLQQVLYRHPDLLVQALLPASASEVFARQFRLGLRRLVWVPVAGVALGCLWRLQGRGPEVSWLLSGLGGALLGCQMVVLAALALHWPHASRAYGLGWTGLVVVWIGGNFAPAALKVQAVAWLNASGDLITGVLPAGWLLGPLHRWINGQPHATDALWLLPAVALASAVPAVRRGLEARYRFREAVFLGYAAEVPEDCDEGERSAFHRQLEQPPQTGVTEVTERVLSREFLMPAAEPTSGWIERLAWRWLTPRQRLLAEWDWADGPSWTYWWKTGAVLLAGSLVLTLSGRLLGWIWLESALPVGGVLGCLACLPVIQGLSGGRASLPAGPDLQLGPLALFPRTMAESLRLSDKVALVRILAALPLLVTFGAVAGHILDRGAWLGAESGLKTAFAASAITPAWLVMRVANQSGDIRRLGWRSAVILAMHLGGLVLSGGLLLAGFLADPGWGWLVLAAAVCRLWERCYRLAYDRCWFDQLRRR